MAIKYQLDTLGWYNFEILCQTLLKAIIGSGVTSFGGTKDGGRDAFFSGEAPFPSKDTNWRGEWIFQVKYTEAGSVNENRKSILKTFKKEAENIRKRRRKWPDNYVLITNISLSATFRNKLHDLISDVGFSGNFHSIDGREVCEFLDIYPQIRRSFPQLIGLADIDKIVNRDLYVKSEAFVSHWQPKLALFVGVSPYFKALDVIQERYFVVLDGPPEAGKSFIGAAITLAYACEGFEIFYVQDPHEIFRAYDASCKQLYFADDAVGTISFDPTLGSYWSRELPGVLRKLDRHHKLIWTARSYILREAIATTKLREHIDNFPGVHEVLVEVGEFTLLEKALILYNHAKLSELSSSARGLVKEHAKSICRHPNFTPERVRQLVQLVLPEIGENLTLKEREDWARKIEHFLENPSERFQRAYETLGPSEKAMLFTLLDLGTRVGKEALKVEYEKRVSVI
jgi:hypothetical protein